MRSGTGFVAGELSDFVLREPSSDSRESFLVQECVLARLERAIQVDRNGSIWLCVHLIHEEGKSIVVPIFLFSEVDLMTFVGV